MSSKSQEQNIMLDFTKWAIVGILLIGGLSANYYYIDEPSALRIIAWLVLVSLAGAIGFQTAKGQQAWDFIREARMELRKVFWPTRQETVQTTLIVLAMVILMALILWGVDSLLMWAIGLLTGQRG